MEGQLLITQLAVLREERTASAGGPCSGTRHRRRASRLNMIVSDNLLSAERNGACSQGLSDHQHALAA